MFTKAKMGFKILYISVFVVVLAFVSGLLSVGDSTVSAQNGPNKAASSAAYVQIGNRTDGYKVLYSYSKTTTVDKVSGASYDEATNTLTLNNLNKPEYVVSANEMGDDFKIEVVGDNHVQYISIWGFGYGGSLEITGTGKLTLNENNKIEYDVIRLLAEKSASRLVIGPYVSIKATLPAASTNSESIIGVYDTSLEAEAFIINNTAANTAYKFEMKNDKSTRIMQAYVATNKKDYEKVINPADPAGQYGLLRYTQNSSGRLYEVYKMVNLPDAGLVGVPDETLSGATLAPGLKLASEGLDDAEISANKDRYFYSAIDTSSFNKKDMEIYEKKGTQYAMNHYTTINDADKTTVDIYSFYSLKDYPEYGFMLAFPIEGLQGLNSMPDGYTPVDGPVYHSFYIKSSLVEIVGATPPKATKAPLVPGNRFKNKKSGGVYIVKGAGKVSYVRPSSKKATDIVIPKKVKGSDGLWYKVISISSKAFKKNTNLKTIVIKSTYLKSKKVSKRAFKGVKKSVTITIPKAKKKAYKKMFRKKGLNKKVKIKIA